MADARNPVLCFLLSHSFKMEICLGFVLCELRRRVVATVLEISFMSQIPAENLPLSEFVALRHSCDCLCFGLLCRKFGLCVWVLTFVSIYFHERWESPWLNGVWILCRRLLDRVLRESRFVLGVRPRLCAQLLASIFCMTKA